MHRILAIFALSIFAPVGGAADWPQWLGPRRDGSSTEIVAPWKGELKVLWRQPVGEGHSGPIVAGGQAYIIAKERASNDETLAAFDAATGKPIWQKSYGRGGFKSFYGNGPRGTPAYADGKLYTFGITGILTCSKAADGEQLWQVDTLKRYQAANLLFGVSCSPLIEGDSVVVNVGGKGASIVAFDKNTGKELWKALDDKASYSSPIAIGASPNRQLVFLTAKGLVAVAPADGKVIWQSPLVDRLSESATTPVVVGDMLFGSSITYGSVGLKFDSGLTKVEQLWHDRELTCYFATPIAVDKTTLFLVTGSLSLIKPSATLHCLDVTTGKKIWSRPNVGKYHASLLRTGDNKLLLLEEAGNLALIEPDTKEYRELARAEICGTTWAHPALADGRLYVRDDRELMCVQLK